MQATGASAVSGKDSKPSSSLLRYGPIALIAIGAVAALVVGRDYLSFAALADNYDLLTAWRDQNWALAAAVFMLAYVLVVAFSVPGAVWLTLVGGFLFGTLAGSVIVIVAATIGATAIFLAARTALGDALRKKAGRWLEKMEAGFRRGEVSYLLILRLVPAVPFFVANLAPAFLGVRAWTFIWTTLIGIIPGTVVYISIGAGLGEQLASGEKPDLGVIFQPHVLGPLLGLAALAALPVLLRATGLLKTRA